MSIKFEDMGLSKEMLKAVEDMGFEEPSPIQELAIPHILEGRDVVGQAQTGTGKTAAFSIPLLERIDPHQKGPQALILCPTRELAIQVAEEISKLASRRRGIAVLPVYGGQSIERQFRGLAKGAHVVVGTPGRIMDHLQRGTLKLDHVYVAVLDEADEMLDMGFRDDIAAILEKTPDSCQKVFFSATMPPAIMDLTKRFLHEPEVLRITQKMLTVPTIEQIYYEVRPHQKMDSLGRLLDSRSFHKALIFCSTKRSVDELTAHLQARGYQADGLHGNLGQSQRDRVMGRFRSGGIEMLVATDVAARGIDVDDVDAVINYDIPSDVENYVHRIGRTGRAGRAGQAFTFVTAREFYKLRDIMRYTKAHIVQNQLPTLHDVSTIRTTRLLDEVRAAMTAGSLDRYTNLVEQFLDEESTSMDMAAALLKLLMQRDFGTHVESEPQREQEEAPRRTPNKFLSRDSDEKRPHSRFRAEGKGKETDARGKWDKDAKGKRSTGKPARAYKDKDMVRLSFNVGNNMHVEPRDLVGAIAGESGIPGRSIGAIEIRDKVSFVDIPQKLADDVMEVMNGSQIRGFTVTVQKAPTKS